MKEVKPYTIYLPLSTHTRLKMYAAKKNMPISEVIMELLEALFRKTTDGEA